MSKNELGNKCLVDTFKIYKNMYDDYNGNQYTKINMFVEMDGLNWDSQEYDNYAEFLQSIIDHAYNVAMGKE